MRSLIVTVAAHMILFVALLFSVGARAEFSVSDPDSVFAKLKKNISTTKTSFGEALQCGEKRTYVAEDARCEYRCSTMFCTSRCESAMGFEAKFDLHIEECTAESASIFGDNGLAVTVHRDDYEADGTWARGLLAAAGQFIQPEGQWKLKGLHPSHVSMIEGGKLVRLRNAWELELELSFGAPGTMTENYVLVMDLDKTGLDQILSLNSGLYATSNTNSSSFFTRRGLVLPKSPGGLFP